jgi:chromosomal replication initiator protein
LGISLPAETTLWNRCIRDLQAELPEQQFNTWIRPLQAVEDEGRLRLLAPNRFVVDWLQEHYIQRILEIIDGSGGNTELVVEVGSRQGAPQPLERPRRVMPGMPSPDRGPATIASRLNPAFTFQTFVEGKSNQLARAAASQIGENPGTSYNPLFIYGGVGLGKIPWLPGTRMPALLMCIRNDSWATWFAAFSTTRFRSSSDRIGRWTHC